MTQAIVSWGNFLKKHTFKMCFWHKGIGFWHKALEA